MAIRCPQCGLEYDVALFQFGIAFRCECGATVRADHIEEAEEPEPAPPPPPAPLKEISAEEAAYRELQREADRISFLIVATDYPEIDIEIAMRALRELCRRHFPDRLELFEMIYAARFRRLWEQFRA